MIDRTGWALITPAVTFMPQSAPYVPYFVEALLILEPVLTSGQQIIGSLAAIQIATFATKRTGEVAMRQVFAMSAVLGIAALLLCGNASLGQQMSRPTINRAVMQRTITQQGTMQQALMQRAAMQRAVMQRAVMQRAVMQRATMGTTMPGSMGTNPTLFGSPSPYGGWGGAFVSPGYGSFGWDYSFGSYPSGTAFPSYNNPISSFVP